MRFVVLSAFIFAASFTPDSPDDRQGWRLERGIGQEGYAAIKPAATDLNVDAIVLACETTANGNFLRLQLHVATAGPLILKVDGPTAMQLDTRAEIAVDDRLFGVELLFADDHVVLADPYQPSPQPPDALLAAMETGRRMVLVFRFTPEGAGQSASVDGKAMFELQTGVGGAAVAAIRRCGATA